MTIVTARLHNDTTRRRAALAPAEQVPRGRKSRCATEGRRGDDRITTASGAVDLAAESHVADGFHVLLTGEQPALEGEQNFEPRAEQLEARRDVPYGRLHPSEEPEGEQ